MVRRQQRSLLRHNSGDVLRRIFAGAFEGVYVVRLQVCLGLCELLGVARVHSRCFCL